MIEVNNLKVFFKIISLPCKKIIPCNITCRERLIIYYAMTEKLGMEKARDTHLKKAQRSPQPQLLRGQIVQLEPALGLLNHLAH